MGSKVAVNFMTYTPTLDHPRVEYSHKCLRALLKNLSFRDGELLWHIADDGSPEGHVEALVKIIREGGFEPTLSNTGHQGYGANMNHATQVLHPLADIIMPIEEDWELVRPFDVSDLAKALMAGQDLDFDIVDCVRLGYLGWTDQVRGQLRQQGGMTFMLFDPSSPETHIFAGHPRIETVDYERRVGPWPEGLRPGYTEMEVCNLEQARIGVAWPLDAGINASQDFCNLFAHVGNVQA